MKLKLIKRVNLWYDVNSFVILLIQLLVHLLIVLLLSYFDSGKMLILFIIFGIAFVFHYVTYNFYNWVINYIEIGEVNILNDKIEIITEGKVIGYNLKQSNEIRLLYNGVRGEAIFGKLPVSDGVNELIITDAENVTHKYLFLIEGNLALGLRKKLAIWYRDGINLIERVKRSGENMYLLKKGDKPFVYLGKKEDLY